MATQKNEHSEEWPPPPSADPPAGLNSVSWWFSQEAPLHLAIAGALIFWFPAMFEVSGVNMAQWLTYSCLTGATIGLVAFVRAWKEFASRWSQAAMILCVLSVAAAIMTFIYGMANL